jgi:23S rRNA maturation-related 3'-5' exoribonuclease YhaM
LDTQVTLADQVQRSFPDLGRINSPGIRDAVVALWRHVSEQNPAHSDIEQIPLNTNRPIDTFGNLASHKRAMATIAQTLVPVYAREWGIALNLDHFLAAALTHDAAKVIEFVEREGQLVATPGFNHAIAGGRIAVAVGLPREVAHMIAAHSYGGPLVRARTREAQLFQFLDPMCVPVFPEHGKSLVDAHLASNGWIPRPEPPDVP